MIITVTLNPALDKTLVLKKVSMGEVNRVDTTRNDMGGKGINVSKVLKELGMISAATGFLGGILEEVFRKELKSIGITDEFQSVTGSTRTNIKVVDEERKEYTDFNEPGPEILPEELSDFYERYHALVKKETWWCSLVESARVYRKRSMESLPKWPKKKEHVSLWMQKEKLWFRPFRKYRFW